MHYQGVQYKHPMDYFLENEATLYAKHTIADVSIPVGIIKSAEFGQNINSPILIENTEYYSSFRLSHFKGGHKIILGNSVSFIYPKSNEKAIFNYKIQGTLSQRIKDTEFVLELLKNKYFAVGGDNPHCFNFGMAEIDLNLDNFIEDNKKYLSYLIEIKNVLSKFVAPTLNLPNFE